MAMAQSISTNTPPHFITGYYLDSRDESLHSQYAIKSVDQLDTSYFEEISIGKIVGIKNGDETKRAVVLDYDFKMNSLYIRFDTIVEAFKAASKSGKSETYHEQYKSLRPNVPLTAKLNKSMKESGSSPEMPHQSLKKGEQKKKAVKRKSRRESDSDSSDCSDGNETISSPPASKDDDLVEIGCNGTKLRQSVLNAIDFGNHRIATRHLLMRLFDRDILATHTLSGRPSPAFLNTRPTKPQLTPTITEDIIEIVMKKSEVSENAVKLAITTKCADENKMARKNKNKKVKK